MGKSNHVESVTVTVTMGGGEQHTVIAPRPGNQGSNPRFVAQQVATGLAELGVRLAAAVEVLYGPQSPVPVPVPVAAPRVPRAADARPRVPRPGGVVPGPSPDPSPTEFVRVPPRSGPSLINFVRARISDDELTGRLARHQAAAQRASVEEVAAEDARVERLAALRWVVRMHALHYRKHPDFNEAWRE